MRIALLLGLHDLFERLRPELYDGLLSLLQPIDEPLRIPQRRHGNDDRKHDEPKLQPNRPPIGIHSIIGSCTGAVP